MARRSPGGGPARLVAFLRAINVGGHVVPMAELRRLFMLERLAGVETFIASGNVIFSAAGASGALETRLEARLERALGYRVAVFIRTGAEVAAVADHQPFPAARVKTARNFSVGFLSEPLARKAESALMALRTKEDEFHVHGREIYWLGQAGQGVSDFSNAVFERTTGVEVTFRGMKTIRRLTAKYGLTA